MRARSLLVIAGLVGLSVGLMAPNASATFHLMKVREVFAGTATDANADFVELQMYQLGQNQVNAEKLRLYSGNGSSRECTITADVAGANNQETILFATTQAQAQFGTADFTIPAFLEPGGGAVCFIGSDGRVIDCVSWGSFPGGVTDQDGGPGTPFAGGIPIGESIDRKVGANGTLEAADDTNNSANDFEAEAPSPNPNGPTAPANAVNTNCGATLQPGADTEPPTSKITSPKHKTAIPTSEARNFQGTAKDQSGTVTKVEIALRQKRKGGCKWWNGSRFAAGGCSSRVFVLADGDKKWSYTLPKNLRRSDGKIRHYTLYSRATDAAGNVESDFIPKVNLVRFEVFKPPITCEPGC